MIVYITLISFIMGGALLAIGILGNGISKLNNLSRTLAVIGGVVFIFLAFYMRDQNKEPHPPIKTAYEIIPPPIETPHEKISPSNEPSCEQTPPPIESVYDKTPPPIKTVNDQIQQPTEPTFEKTPQPTEPTYEQTPQPIKKPNKKAPQPITASYKPDVNFLSEYSTPNDEVKNVSEGTIYNIRITCEINAENEAYQGLSEIYFSVRLNGEVLYPQGDPGTVQDSNGWQVYQEYRTKTFQKGVDYSLIGTTYKKPEIYLGSRKIILKCE
jgi:hypothetical protein